MYWQNRIKKIVYFSAVLVLIIAIMFSGLQILESTVLHIGTEADGKVQSKTITKNGIEYFPRQDIETYLILGIDRSGPVKDSGYHMNEGAADTIMLLVFDQKAKTIHILALNRDTMTDLSVLGIDGRKAGTKYGQLALAHTYGNGLESSCENTAETVSKLLYGVKIDHYVSLNMDTVAVINDAVDGVKVNVTEDFSAVDSSIPKGEIILKGQQALSYVRMRQNLGDQLNTSRMKRQQEYMESFMESLKVKVSKSPNFALKMLEEISPFMVTDCSLTVLSSALDRYQDYDLQESITPKGENKVGKEFMEFHLDKADLDEIVFRLLYAPKK